jgi:hypothetical protein
MAISASANNNVWRSENGVAAASSAIEIMKSVINGESKANVAIEKKGGISVMKAAIS